MSIMNKKSKQRLMVILLTIISICLINKITCNNTEVELKFLQAEKASTTSESEKKIPATLPALITDVNTFFTPPVDPVLPKVRSVVQEYDMYVMAIQWGPTLCLKSKTCEKKIHNIPKNVFTLHGLWPSLQSGSRLEKCKQDGDVKIESDGSSLFTEMEKNWLSYTGPNEGFWGHEFNTHGYCYTQKYQLEGYKEFFDYTVQLFDKFEFSNIMINLFHGDVNPGEHTFKHSELEEHIQSVVGDMKFKVTCGFEDHKQYLQEIRFLFDIDMEPLVLDFNTNCSYKKDTIVILE